MYYLFKDQNLEITFASQKVVNCLFYLKEKDWGHVEVDGYIFTGQNPASSEVIAKGLVKLIEELSEVN